MGRRSSKDEGERVSVTGDRRAAFEAAAAIADKTERLLEAAAVLAEDLPEIDRDPVVIGGWPLPTGWKAPRPPTTSTLRRSTTPSFLSVSKPFWDDEGRSRLADTRPARHLGTTRRFAAASTARDSRSVLGKNASITFSHAPSQRGRGAGAKESRNARAAHRPPRAFRVAIARRRA